MKSALRVVELLEVLSTSRHPLRLSDIAQQLGIPTSSASMLMKTLVSTGIVTRDDAKGAYRLGPKLLALANSVLQSFDIRQIARPVMTEVATRVRSTCNLAILDRTHVVYLEKVQDPTSTVQLVTHVGARLPAHATALGKVLVATKDPVDREAWLGSYEFTSVTPNTCRSKGEFLRSIAGFAQMGYTVDDEESHPGVMCFAAPVRDYSGGVVAALSLSGIKGAGLGFDSKEDVAAEEVKGAAERLSALLGYGAPVDTEPPSLSVHG